MVDAKTYNVWLHSVCFCFIFAAFQTATMTSQSVIAQFEAETRNLTNNPEYTIIDGYTSQLVLYVVFAISSWFVPMIISKTGSRFGMIVGGVTYVFYVSAFISPSSIYMWTASIALGMGAGILWTSQGRFLTKCGTSETKKKNGGIFWAFLQGGALLGNIIVFIAFKDGIESNSRIIAFTIFTILTSIGVACFKLLKHVEEEPEDVETMSLKKSEENEEESEKSPMEVFKNSLALLTNSKMMIMMVVFVYSGISQVFVFGIHGTCVRTSTFGDNFIGDKSDQLMAVTGLFIAIGSMSAGVVDSNLSGFSTQVKFRVAMFVQIIAYFICVGNFGDDAAKGKKQAEVKDGAILELNGMYWEEKSSLMAAMLSSLLVAFGDGLMNTQIFFYLTTNFTGTNAAAAFSIFKSIQSFSVAGANLYASKLALGYQLGLAVVFSLVSVLLYAFSGFNPEPTEPTKSDDEIKEST